MKKKNVIGIAVVLLATSVFGLEPSEALKLYRASRTNDAARREWTELRAKNRNLIWDVLSQMNGVELLLTCGVIDSVSVTSTELTIMFKRGGFRVEHNGTSRSTAEYAEANEPLILTPDQGASISDGYHSSLIFTPVSFQDKRKGFRVICQANLLSVGDGLKHWFGYVALSDTPVEVGEDDVEMILEGGEWIPFEGNTIWQDRPGWKNRNEAETSEAQETPPIIEDPETATQDEGRATASAPSRLWLYVVIALCTLSAVLWLARKKRT